jgi:flagellin
MALDIRSNIPSIIAQKNVNLTTKGIQTAFERLSSGMRINHASDDAAGLAIAEALKADSRVATVAMRNASDGISIISITDGAIGQITNILSRLGELAEQSANGIFSNEQRSALDLEFRALMSEVERIAYTTEFNGLRLLSGGDMVTFQVGFDGGSNSRVSYNGIAATLNSIGLAHTNELPIYSIIDVSDVESQSAARNAIDAINHAIDSITKNRGTLGAAESRLNSAIANLTVARENFLQAESQIRDADVAQEAAELTRLNILQQAGTAVLAQANQQPRLVLQLLNG